MNDTVSTRSSRDRRAVALMGWGCLVSTAFLLWNARETGSIRAVTDEPVAFILAAFAAFVGVFSWMLYNPGRRSAAESPSLFLAATATLFPPSIIGFCLMPIDSPLRWWLALGLFLLCVIAVLSHVPDEFFGVPRGRNSYLTPIPAFDRVEGTVLDPNASWFKLEDLTRVVLDTPRPSLAPKSYLQRPDTLRPAATVRAEVRQASEVDDILGSDFDLGLLDDDFALDDPEPHEYSTPQPAKNSRVEPRESFQRSEYSDPHTNARPGPWARRSGGLVYETFNPEPGRLQTTQRNRREESRLQEIGQSPGRTARHASSLRIEPLQGRSSATASTAGTAGSNLLDRSQSDSSLYGKTRTPERKSRTYSQNESTERSQRQSSQSSSAIGESQYRSPTESADGSVTRGDFARRQQETHSQRALTGQEALEREQSHRDSRQSRYQKTRRRRQQTSESQEYRREEDSSSGSPASDSGFSATPIPLGPVTPPQGFLEEPHPTPQQLFGQTIQQDTNVSEQPVARNQQRSDRTPRRSRYDEDAVDAKDRRRAETQTRESATTAQKTTAAAPGRSSGLKNSQAFERTADEDGSELVEGVMKVHFDKGQKRANVHIPFSPPLPGMPEVECECVGGEDLRLKVPVRQSYGIRIEARRSKADQALDAEIGFSAVYTDD